MVLAGVVAARVGDVGEADLAECADGKVADVARTWRRWLRRRPGQPDPTAVWIDRVSKRKASHGRGATRVFSQTPVVARIDLVGRKMSQSSPPSHRSTMGPPAAPSDDPGRLTEKASVVIGIVTGVLGALLTVGFALLPTATGAEKIYIIIASLALSVAAVSGIGAWRSGRRFAFTAVSTGLAIICLAGLSVATQAGPTQTSQSKNMPASDSPGSTQPTTVSPTTAPPTMTASTSTSSPTPNSSQATPPGTPDSGSQPLTDMTPVSGSSSNFQSGTQSVKGQSYQQTLYDTWNDNNCAYYNSDSTTYELNYKYRKLHVVVGLADTSPSGDMMQFSVLVDNQKKGVSPTLEAGQTETINVDVTGAYRITLQDSCTSAANAGGNNVIAVWVNPVVSP